MNFLYLCLIYFLLNISVIQGNNNINKIKNDMYNNIIICRDNYLSIKRSVLSPYNNVSISYNHYLDSLKILSTELETNRRELFLLTNKIQLTYEDICLIDELNNNSILLYNIINGFGKVYSSYFFNLNVPYSINEYLADTEELLKLEKNIPYLDCK